MTVRLGLDLSSLLKALPEHGLLAVLEAADPVGAGAEAATARGLFALSHGAMDALIEVQTTGRVDPQLWPPRPVTDIDEALCRDFIDLSLASFARETAETEGRDWPERAGFGSRVAERDQLTLLLPEGAYHLLVAEVTLGDGGHRGGRIVLCLPQGAAVERPSEPQSAPHGWRRDLKSALDAAPVPLEAVLMRLTRPLGEVEALAPGDILRFDAADLAAVALETPDRHVVLRGALGQIGGRRALRLTETLRDAPGPSPDPGPSPRPAQLEVAGPPSTAPPSPPDPSADATPVSGV